MGEWIAAGGDGWRGHYQRECSSGRWLWGREPGREELEGLLQGDVQGKVHRTEEAPLLKPQ